MKFFFYLIYFIIFLWGYPLLGVKRSIEEKKLFIYNWQDYIPEEILKQFSQETGIEVIYDRFASVEELDVKLLVRSSGYDVVFPPAYPILGRGIENGLFLHLDKRLIPNAKDLDEELLKKLDPIDPQRVYAIPYLWGTTGIGYDSNALAKLGINPDSWAIIFDPTYAKRLAFCRQSLIDSPLDILQAALLYLKKSPSSTDPQDWDQAAQVIMNIRPYITLFEEGSRQIYSLINGSSHLLLGYSTYVNMARRQGKALRPPKEIRYIIPREGSVVWFDVMAIPKDAPHPGNAHLFINFILRPEVIGYISNKLQAANAVPSSYPFIEKDLLTNPSIFPPSEVIKRLYSDFIPSLSLQRHISRLWLKIKMNYPIKRENSSQ